MSGVFLSYRRDDTAEYAQRIYDRLAGKFGPDLVYLDVEDIPLGVDFIEHITEVLEAAAYVLIAIGPRWLLVTDDEGRKRLDDGDDPVRYEIRTALQNKRLVVPMLIDGADMPHKHDLPEEIAPLVRHNGIAIRSDPDFEADVQALMEGLHLDRLDKKRVPMVFRVGAMARDLGLGGATGWGILGLGLGILSLQQGNFGQLIALTLAGMVAGLTGGSLVGWLTALLIRHKAPPLVSSKVRWMGVTWSLGLILTVVIAGVIGYFLGMGAWSDAVDSADGFGAAIGAIIIGIIIFALIMFMLVVVGLIVGSSVAAAYFARKLRLRSEEISRSRGIVIGFVWLIGGLVSGAVFVTLLSVISG